MEEVRDKKILKIITKISELSNIPTSIQTTNERATLTKAIYKGVKLIGGDLSIKSFQKFTNLQKIIREIKKDPSKKYIGIQNNEYNQPALILYNDKTKNNTTKAIKI